MRIFVTGACGFLASHLIESLINDGHEIIGNDTLVCGDMANARCVWHNADCRDYNTLSKLMADFKTEVIIHTAALAHEGLSSFSPYFISSSIYDSSISVFSAAISAGVKRIVYMSSMSRYGDNELPFHEDQPANPIDPYAVAKVAAEDTLRILAKTHGVAYSILVPHNIIGTRQRYVDPFRNVASIMINRCLQGKPPIIYGDGEQTRCFSPVDDCVPSIIRAVYGDADGEVVNIGPDTGELTINELAGMVMDLTGFSGEPIHMPDRPNEVKHAYCSSDKARRLLGYKEKQTVYDCLKEMVAACEPKPFVYDFPIEIEKGCPQVWLEKMQ